MVGFMKSALNLLGLGEKKGVAESVDLDTFLAELATKVPYEIEFKKSQGDGAGIYYEIDGADAEVFVGRSTEVLDALSHLSSRILRRAQGPVEVDTTAPREAGTPQEYSLLRVVFDTAGFRSKREEELKSLAATQREKVLASGGKPSYIPALSPAERKIIHTHLAELGEVVSESIGKGNFKRIRVRLPEDSPLRKEQPRGAHPRNNNGPRQNAGGSRRNGRGAGGGRSRRPYNPDAPNSESLDDNFGNYAPSEQELALEDSALPDIDDNIGNRAKPGENSPYNKYNS